MLAWDAVAMPPRLAHVGSRVARRLDDPDVALVARALAGARDAFEELVHRHADRLYAVVRRLGLSDEAAEEVTQEAFLRAWRAIGSFRGEAQFGTWLYRIGFNEAKRRLRREPARALLGSLDDEGAVEPPDLREEPHLRVAQGELRTALASAVRGLSLRYRAPLILRDIEGLSTAEAAAILGLSEAAFKSRLHRARAAVRDALEGQVDGAG
jgi:RNA polymerase sigma-70 factor, ECF subfamily